MLFNEYLHIYFVFMFVQHKTKFEGGGEIASVFLKNTEF